MRETEKQFQSIENEIERKNWNHNNHNNLENFQKTRENQPNPAFMTNERKQAETIEILNRCISSLANREWTTKINKF